MATTTTDAAGSDPIENWLASGAGTEKVRITSGGNVGIGTTSPGGKLHVKTGASGATAHVNADEIVAESDGNAGISILAPNNATGAIFFGDPEDATAGQISYAHSTNNMDFKTQAGTRFTILGNGDIYVVNNMGIGTTSPGALLDVRGNVIINEDGADKDVRIEGDTDANLLFTDASADKVGVGTNAPAAKLHVKCDGSSVDQLRLESSQSGGKSWAMSCGIDSAAGDLSIRNQTDGLTVAAFHTDTLGNGIRAFRVGLRDGSQSNQEAIGIGQMITLLGSARDGNAMSMRVDHSSKFGQLAVLFRNEADSGSFTAGYLTIRKIASANKGTLALATHDGSSSNEVIFLDENKNVKINAGDPANGVGVMAINNATTTPISNPSSGGILYVSGGALMYRSAGGNVTTLAANT